MKNRVEEILRDLLNIKVICIDLSILEETQFAFRIHQAPIRRYHAVIQTEKVICESNLNVRKLITGVGVTAGGGGEVKNRARPDLGSRQHWKGLDGGKSSF